MPPNNNDEFAARFDPTIKYHVDLDDDYGTDRNLYLGRCDNDDCTRYHIFVCSVMRRDRPDPQGGSGALPHVDFFVGAELADHDNRIIDAAVEHWGIAVDVNNLGTHRAIIRDVANTAGDRGRV